MENDDYKEVTAKMRLVEGVRYIIIEGKAFTCATAALRLDSNAAAIRNVCYRAQEDDSKFYQLLNDHLWKLYHGFEPKTKVYHFEGQRYPKRPKGMPRVTKEINPKWGSLKGDRSHGDSDVLQTRPKYCPHDPASYPFYVNGEYYIGGKNS